MVSVFFLGLLLIIEIPVLNANSIAPDEMPHTLASDLDLHYFANVQFRGRQA